VADFSLMPEVFVSNRAMAPVVSRAVQLGSLRTALENRPASDGSVFLVSEHNRNIVLPGLILRSRKGPAPLASDRPFIGNLRIASHRDQTLAASRASECKRGYTGDVVASPYVHLTVSCFMGWFRCSGLE
jgi:hypothetical protein